MISLALSLALASSGICNPLQKCNLELEARVGIEQVSRLSKSPPKPFGSGHFPNCCTGKEINTGR